MTAQATPEDLQFEIRRVDDQIRLELELVGQRMTWMSISHSFLFSAFTLEAVSNSSKAADVRLVLRLAIPVIGLTSATTVGFAILAALAAGKELRADRVLLENAQRNAPRRIQRSARWLIGIGDFPPKVIPWLLVSVWSILLFRVVF